MSSTATFFSSTNTAINPSVNSLLINNPQLIKKLCIQITNKLNKSVFIKQNMPGVLFYKKRVEGFNIYNETVNAYLIKMEQEVGSARKNIVARLKNKKISAAQDKIINDSLDKLNILMGEMSQNLAMIKCSLVNGKNGIGACQEYSTIAIALIYNFLSNNNDELASNIESIVFSMKVDKEINHQLVVINRNQSSKLTNINEWGDNCIIFDPHQGWVGTIDEIPASSSLTSIKERGEDAGFDMAHQINLNAVEQKLGQYYSDKLFGELNQVSGHCITEFFNRKLKKLMQSMESIVRFPIELNKNMGIEVLSTLTKNDNWKAYYQQKSGYIFLLQGLSQQEFADTVNTLKKSGVCTVSEMRIQNSDVKVIQVTNLNFSKLHKLESTTINTEMNMLRLEFNQNIEKNDASSSSSSSARI